MILASGRAEALCFGETFHGTVVDDETGEPIEGAVVVVEWKKYSYVCWPCNPHLHEVVEVLTDSSGAFEVSARPSIDPNPLTYVDADDPTVVVFAPFYAEFPNLRSSEVVLAELERGVELRLKRLRS